MASKKVPPDLALTLVCDHTARKVIWGGAGKDADTLDTFFAELGTQRAGALQAVSSDMSAAFGKSIKANAPQATRCIDPFHAVKIVTDALDTVRRAAWQQMRAADPAAASGARGDAGQGCLLEGGAAVPRV